MSDERKKELLAGLDDLDWDSALDEWEKNSFFPEQAADVKTSGPPPAAEPPIPAAAAPPQIESQPPVAPPPGGEVRPAARTSPGEDADPLLGSAAGASSLAPSPQAKGGGLNQLFARGPKASPSKPGMAAVAPPTAPTLDPNAETAERPALGPEPASLAPARPNADDDDDFESATKVLDRDALSAADLEHLAAGPKSAPPTAPPPAQAAADALPGALSAPPPPPSLAPPPLPPPPSVAPPSVPPRTSPSIVPPLSARPAASAPPPLSTRPAASAPPPLSTRPAASAPPPLSTRPAASLPPLSSAPPPVGASAPPGSLHPAATGDERPVSRWLDADRTAAFGARIEWLEEEARALTEANARGRALLAVSELCALAGDGERALALAVEARELAPELPLAWLQARQLAPRDSDALVEALDAEAARAPTPAARAHASLLAADVLRASGMGDAAIDRWESASKLDPSDSRGPIARAALALAQSDHGSPALSLADNSELIALDKAIATALRLRGVERAGADVDPMPINDGLRRTRVALASGDTVGAAQALADLGQSAVPAEIAKGALWLSAALGATTIAGRRGSAKALKTLAAGGERLASRPLAARGVELADPELVAGALAAEGLFTPAERATLEVLLPTARETPLLDSPLLDSPLLASPELAPLADAIAALTPVADVADDQIMARATRAAGRPAVRAATALGRALAAKASDAAIDRALTELPATRSASAGGVAIESAVRGRRWGELSEALSSLPGDASQRHVAAAIVAERAGEPARAKAAWLAAAEDEGGGRETARSGDGILRIAAELDPSGDLAGQLMKLAEGMDDGVPSAVLRLESLARHKLDDADHTAALERAHRAAPSLGIAAFFCERIGRRNGDLDEVLRWIQERRAISTDPLETALDAVREALLVADRDPGLAANRLEEAHRARPNDVALRELHERLAQEPLTDRAAWREQRAAAASGTGAAFLWLEAALEHEHGRDFAGVLRAAERAAGAGDSGLHRALRERAELALGDTTRQTAELLELTKNDGDEDARREALERLAILDGIGKKDNAAAILWHRTILERAPAHKPSLRWLEHVLVTEGRDEELVSVLEGIAEALSGTGGGEPSAHAQHAARLRARETASGGGPDALKAWEQTFEMVKLAASQPEPSLWALRQMNAHARARFRAGETGTAHEDAILTTTLALLDRTQRAPERGALLLRASESAARLGRSEDARGFLERAAGEDPGDVVTWGTLAEVRANAGEAKAAAEACESLARTSVVREHQLLAWHDASKLWFDEVKDVERAMAALEAAAEIDATYADVFPRLSALYADRGLDAELARLLEKRLALVHDEDERVTLEVELARAFADMGELGKAKTALDRALEKRPDLGTALAALADISSRQGDWTSAESAYVRLARLLTEAAEQQAIYERLAEIYTQHAPNLSRAEVALKEVLKRSPNHPVWLAKLVDVYRRQGDVQRAVETQQEIVALSTDADLRLSALIELAKIYEVVGRDPRRSEQVLDSARKEYPTSVTALRAMAEFYSRQRQMPAMQILLDRAAADARRAFAQGRFVPSLFQVLHAAFELRGKRDAARVVAATLSAVEGNKSDLQGAEARAVDPRLDDLLAPDLMNPALRALLARAGDALDAVAPLDLRALRAQPLQPGTPIGATVGSVATVVGLGALQILVSPQLGRVAIPLASNPPTLLVGEELARVKNERARMFIVVRAMKMILGRGSALLRGTPPDVANLVAGLFNAFNPQFVPPGVDPRRVGDLARRIGPALPRNLDPSTGVIALEAAGMLGTSFPQLGAAAQTWANRVALLAIGDPNGALDAIAWGHGEEAAPSGAEERAAWVARHAEARDLMTFSVTDAYAESRTRLAIDR